MKQHANSCPVPNGTLIIIGGNENKSGWAEKQVQQDGADPLEILKKFIELTGKEHPVIEVITTASEEGGDSFKDYKKVFKQLGVTQVGHIHHDRRAEVLAADLAERIQQADGVFFSGGDQMKLTSLYGGTTLLLDLKMRYIYEGLILAGTSAGAMAFSTPMIFSGGKEKQQIAGEIKITTGLEFLKDVCIDTHFVDRSRFVRMAQVIVTNPSCIGIGIEEDTAVIVRNGTELTIAGSGVVTVIEGFGITDSNIMEYGNDKKISIQDLNVKLLSDGDCYRIELRNPPHL